MPIAPAPTEESDSSTPSTAPSVIVSPAISLSVRLSKNGATAIRSRRRKRNVTAANISTNPSVVVIAALISLEATPKYASIQSESAAPGTLPDASLRVTRQSIALLRL